MEMGRRKRESGMEREAPGRPRELSGGLWAWSWEGHENCPAQGVPEWREGEKEDRNGGEGAAMGQGKKKAGRGGERPREGEEAAETGVPGSEEASSICSARHGATDIPGRGF